MDLGLGGSQLESYQQDRRSICGRAETQAAREASQPRPGILPGGCPQGSEACAQKT